MLPYAEINLYFYLTMGVKKRQFDFNPEQLFLISLSSLVFSVLLCSPKNFGGAYSRRLVRPSVRPSVSPSVRQSVSPSVRPICVRPITLLFEVGFRNYFTEMTTMLRRCVARKIWVPTLKVKVTARPCSKIVSGP